MLTYRRMAAISALFYRVCGISFQGRGRYCGCYAHGMEILWPDQRQRCRQMIASIRNEARLCARYTGRPVLSGRVLAAMEEIPRHYFVPRSLYMSAYDNAALPVGCGQTISQPFIVALMTDLLDLDGTERVLEIGTGTGYQTAILSRLAAEVYSVEYLPGLLEQARRRLAGLDCDNVRLKQGNGWRGWPAHAPYDAIIVTAAPERVPPDLLEQLGRGGRLVVPVGPTGHTQQLLRIERQADGSIRQRDVLPVVFVPLVDD